MAKRRNPLALAAPATLLAGLALGACVNQTPMDDLALAEPTAAAFDTALFQDYRFLAYSFGDVGASDETTFDQEGSISLAKMPNDVAALASDYAKKALLAARGSEVDPESGIDNETHKMRNRVVRAIAAGKANFPADAARVQADYDCWMMDARVPSLARASAQCRKSLDVTLARLEGEAHPAAEPETAAKPAQEPVPNEEAPDTGAQSPGAPSNSAPSDSGGDTAGP